MEDEKKSLLRLENKFRAVVLGINVVSNFHRISKKESVKNVLNGVHNVLKKEQKKFHEQLKIEQEVINDQICFEKRKGKGMELPSYMKSELVKTAPGGTYFLR